MHEARTDTTAFPLLSVRDEPVRKRQPILVQLESAYREGDEVPILSYFPPHPGSTSCKVNR